MKVSMALLLEGSEPIRDVGRWIDDICPLPSKAIIKSPWRSAVLQGRMDTAGPNGLQILIIAGALFPGTDLTRLAWKYPDLEGFDPQDAIPELQYLVEFADARWRLAHSAYVAWQLLHLSPIYLEQLSDYPLPGSRG